MSLSPRGDNHPVRGWSGGARFGTIGPSRRPLPLGGILLVRPSVCYEHSHEISHPPGHPGPPAPARHSLRTAPYGNVPRPLGTRPLRTRPLGAPALGTRPLRTPALCTRPLGAPALGAPALRTRPLGTPAFDAHLSAHGSPNLSKPLTQRSPLDLPDDTQPQHLPQGRAAQQQDTWIQLQQQSSP